MQNPQVVSDQTADDTILLALNELHTHGMVEPNSIDSRIKFALLHGHNTPRPVGLPESACVYVERNVAKIMDWLFELRVGSSLVTEEDFRREVSDLIFQEVKGTAEELDIRTAAAQTPMTILPFYLALAIYTKYLAATQCNPPLIVREDIGQVVHFRSLVPEHQ